MFIDEVEIRVRSGRGGNGCVSFRHEKYVPRGGPDGGDGGSGGDVVIRVDPHSRTLLDLRYRSRYKAADGRAGSGARKTGRSAEAVVITVPSGTVIEDSETGETLADLTGPADEIVAARGGRGGRGNWHFRSATDQAPRRATPGAAGEERRLRLTLKLIADVGLVGLPNAGKSTLLRAVSRAEPLVAAYPFSTTTPTLGIVSIDASASFCMVDIPGLIEGAHEGKGLGLEFLRHIERCRVLLLVIDAAVGAGEAAAGETAPEEAYRQLLSELGQYSEVMFEKPRLVALNKVDLVPGGAEAVDFRPALGESVFHISALAGTGVDELVRALYRVVLDESAGES